MDQSLQGNAVQAPAGRKKPSPEQVKEMAFQDADPPVYIDMMQYTLYMHINGCHHCV